MPTATLPDQAELAELASLPSVIQFVDLPQVDLLGNPSLPTLHRWRKAGINGCRLASYKSGGKRFVTRGAIVTFLSAQNGGELPAMEAETPTARSRRRRGEIKTAELETADI